MKSLKQLVKHELKTSPELSTYINFAKAIRGSGFTREQIRKGFWNYVHPSDYDKEDFDEILDHLCEMAVTKSRVNFVPKPIENKGIFKVRL